MDSGFINSKISKDDDKFQYDVKKNFPVGVDANDWDSESDSINNNQQEIKSSSKAEYANSNEISDFAVKQVIGNASKESNIKNSTPRQTKIVSDVNNGVTDWLDEDSEVEAIRIDELEAPLIQKSIDYVHTTRPKNAFSESKITNPIASLLGKNMEPEDIMVTQKSNVSNQNINPLVLQDATIHLESEMDEISEDIIIEEDYCDDFGQGDTASGSSGGF
jgi:hypothetical protein